jgi:NAD(P)-dependent dehydrogenase (short-subunit alcohol dehydrogenase family)
MLDSGGANTTAAAAVLTVERKLELKGRRVLVLGGTGPVGQRVARLLARRGAEVRVGSRLRDRAEQVCAAIAARLGPGFPAPSAWSAGEGAALTAALEGVEAVIAAGPPGATLLSASARTGARSLQAAVDLNAVPPAGIEGVGPMDSSKLLDGVEAHGALAVGGLKMKIHKAAIARLFEANDRVLDAEEMLEIGVSLGKV